MPPIRRTVLYCLLCCIGLPGAATAGRWPAPIQQLADKGLVIVKRFDAPGGLQGFAARAGTHPVALYLTPDGQHVIVGTLLDAHGKNLTKAQLDAAITQPARTRVWAALKQSAWIADGDDDAPRVVYVFTDPNCGFCHKFYEKSRPWVAAGKVQLRHIPVGVLQPSSPAKAAALLAADDPGAALQAHENNYRRGGIEPMQAVPEKIKAAVMANGLLMSRLAFRGTPGIVYKDDQGQIQTAEGVPSGGALGAVLGPR